MEDFISQMLLHVRGIWKYRWYAVGVMWLVALAGWGAVFSMPNDYQSSARVFVDTQTILKPLMAGMTSVPNVQQQVSIMSRTLLSRPNVERVMRMVDLDVNSTTPREHERMVETLMARIKITGTNTNDIYSITYNNKDPKLVHGVVQSLLTIFLEGSFKGKKGDSQQAIQFIDEQIRTYEQRLISAENLVKQFKLRNSGLLPRQGVDYSSQLAIASDALSAARLELAEAEQSRLALLAQINGETPLLAQDPRPRPPSNPDIDVRIAAIQKNLDTLRLNFTELHPDIVAARRLLLQLEERKIEEAKLVGPDSDPGMKYSPMLQQLKVTLAETDAKIAAVRVRVQEYQARQQRLQTRSDAVPEIESQLAQLNRDYEINKDHYEKLIARREAAKLSGDLSSNTEMMAFKIIDPPTVPIAPVGPNRKLMYSAVMLAALLAGPGLALLFSQARPTFSGPGAMRELTGLNVLGTVSMNWNEAEKRKLRRGQYLLALFMFGLVAMYGVVMMSGLF